MIGNVLFMCAILFTDHKLSFTLTVDLPQNIKLLTNPKQLTNPSTYALLTYTPLGHELLTHPLQLYVMQRECRRKPLITPALTVTSLWGD